MPDFNDLPDGVRLGVNPLSWTNDVLEDLGCDIPLGTCLTDAAEVGYQGVELGRKFPRDAATLGPLLRDHGLALISGWHSGRLAEGSVAEEWQAAADHAALLSTLGAEVMVYGETAMMASLDAPMTARQIMPADDVSAYASRLTEFGKRLHAEYGVRLAYHHHLMMVTETYDETARLLGAGGPELGLLLDTGHAAAGGFDYTRLIDTFGGRILHIHLKDIRPEVMAGVRTRDLSFNDGVRAGMFTVPGDGFTNFAPLAKFVRDGGYRGWLVVEAEQDPKRAAPRPAVTRALSHVLATFAKETTA